MRDHRTLEAWKQARILARIGLRLARDHWRPYAAGAFAQLQRASLSVQLNIAEGYARCAPAQFRQMLNVAYGSAVEAEEILELMVDEEVIAREAGMAAILVARRSQRLLLGLLKRYRRPILPNPGTPA